MSDTRRTPPFDLLPVLQHPFDLSSKSTALPRERTPPSSSRLRNDLVLALPESLLGCEVVRLLLREAFFLGPSDEVRVSVRGAIDAEFEQFGEGLRGSSVKGVVWSAMGGGSMDKKAHLCKVVVETILDQKRRAKVSNESRKRKGRFTDLVLCVHLDPLLRLWVVQEGHVARKHHQLLPDRRRLELPRAIPDALFPGQREEETVVLVGKPDRIDSGRMICQLARACRLMRLG